MVATMASLHRHKADMVISNPANMALHQDNLHMVLPMEAHLPLHLRASFLLIISPDMALHHLCHPAQ